MLRAGIFWAIVPYLCAQTPAPRAPGKASIDCTSYQDDQGRKVSPCALLEGQAKPHTAGAARLLLPAIWPLEYPLCDLFPDVSLVMTGGFGSFGPEIHVKMSRAQDRAHLADPVPKPAR